MQNEPPDTRSADNQGGSDIRETPRPRGARYRIDGFVMNAYILRDLENEFTND